MLVEVRVSIGVARFELLAIEMGDALVEVYVERVRAALVAVEPLRASVTIATVPAGLTAAGDARSPRDLRGAVRAARAIVEIVDP